MLNSVHRFRDAVQPNPTRAYLSTNLTTARLMGKNTLHFGRPEIASHLPALHFEGQGDRLHPLMRLLLSLGILLSTAGVSAIPPQTSVGRGPLVSASVSQSGTVDNTDWNEIEACPFPLEGSQSPTPLPSAEEKGQMYLAELNRVWPGLISNTPTPPDVFRLGSSFLPPPPQLLAPPVSQVRYADLNWHYINTFLNTGNRLANTPAPVVEAVHTLRIKVLKDGIQQGDIPAHTLAEAIYSAKTFPQGANQLTADRRNDMLNELMPLLVPFTTQVVVDRYDPKTKTITRTLASPDDSALMASWASDPFVEITDLRMFAKDALVQLGHGPSIEALASSAANELSNANTHLAPQTLIQDIARLQNSPHESVSDLNGAVMDYLFPQHDQGNWELRTPPTTVPKGTVLSDLEYLYAQKELLATALGYWFNQHGADEHLASAVQTWVQRNGDNQVSTPAETRLFDLITQMAMADPQYQELWISYVATNPVVAKAVLFRTPQEDGPHRLARAHVAQWILNNPEVLDTLISQLFSGDYTPLVTFTKPQVVTANNRSAKQLALMFMGEGMESKYLTSILSALSDSTQETRNVAYSALISVHGASTSPVSQQVLDALFKTVSKGYLSEDDRRRALQTIFTLLAPPRLNESLQGQAESLFPTPFPSWVQANQYNPYFMRNEFGEITFHPEINPFLSLGRTNFEDTLASQSSPVSSAVLERLSQDATFRRTVLKPLLEELQSGQIKLRSYDIMNYFEANRGGHPDLSSFEADLPFLILRLFAATHFEEAEPYLQEIVRNPDRFAPEIPPTMDQAYLEAIGMVPLTLRTVALESLGGVMPLGALSSSGEVSSLDLLMRGVRDATPMISAASMRGLEQFANRVEVARVQGTLQGATLQRIQQELIPPLMQLLRWMEQGSNPMMADSITRENFQFKLVRILDDLGGRQTLITEANARWKSNNPDLTLRAIVHGLISNGVSEEDWTTAGADADMVSFFLRQQFYLGNLWSSCMSRFPARGDHLHVDADLVTDVSGSGAHVTGLPSQLQYLGAYIGETDHAEATYYTFARDVNGVEQGRVLTIDAISPLIEHLDRPSRQWIEDELADAVALHLTGVYHFDTSSNSVTPTGFAKRIMSLDGYERMNAIAGAYHLLSAMGTTHAISSGNSQEQPLMEAMPHMGFLNPLGQFVKPNGDFQGHPGVHLIGAMDAYLNTLAPFSSGNDPFSSQAQEVILAPGVGDLTLLYNPVTQQYELEPVPGTSFSGPNFAKVINYLKEARRQAGLPNWTEAQWDVAIRRALTPLDRDYASWEGYRFDPFHLALIAAQRNPEDSIEGLLLPTLASPTPPSPLGPK